MAAPSQQQPQPYSASGYPPPITPQGPPPGQFGGFANQLGQGQYPIQQTPMSFEKFVIIHIATTCDEHGVYVTKDSAEVIEIGWVVIDARDPDMREVSEFVDLFRHRRFGISLIMLFTLPQSSDHCTC